MVSPLLSARCRVHQAVAVDDEVAGVSVVYGHLALGAPRPLGLGVVWVEAEDVDLREVLQMGTLRVDHVAADHEVQDLPGHQVVNGAE